MPNELVLWFLAAELLGLVLTLRIQRALGAARRRASALLDRALEESASLRA
jgi:hypothetical protein